jgi:hypothetical protein
VPSESDQTKICVTDFPGLPLGSGISAAISARPRSLCAREVPSCCRTGHGEGWLTAPSVLTTAHFPLARSRLSLYSLCPDLVDEKDERLPELNHIRIDEMHERHRGLTQAVAAAYEEAASVCLNRYHAPPVEITVSDNSKEMTAEMRWVIPEPRTIGAWANTTDTTENGAYCCVIAGIELLRSLFAVRRAETGTGSDYYVGPQGSGQSDLEDCLRLEVSGVSAGDYQKVRKRLREKVEQALRGNSSLPALAGVVGFSAKLLMVQEVGEEV